VPKSIKMSNNSAKPFCNNCNKIVGVNFDCQFCFNHLKCENCGCKEEEYSLLCGKILCDNCYDIEDAIDDEDSEDEEEVRCVCPKCYGEGWCYVSANRAKELQKLGLMEDNCPYGDDCEGDEEN
jgi:hypothetical protein